MRTVWVALSGVVLAALSVPSLAQDEIVEDVTAEPESDYPEPPEIIAERIEGDRFEPGNFEYLRGYFPEASDPEKAQYAEIIDWLDQCGAEAEARRNAEMAELGVTLEGSLVGGAANVCGQVTRGEQFESFASYDELVEATRGARLVLNTLIEAIARAEERTGPFSTDDLGGDLHHRTLGEQMLRLAFSWGWREVDNPRLPQMNEGERTVFLALLNAETIRIDNRNTQWLKAIVAEQGWPTISQVGERGAGAAWLLTSMPTWTRRSSLGCFA